KLIAILRNPVHAARARHCHRRLFLQEDIDDFEQAWNAQADRRAGKRLPPRVLSPALTQYGAIYSYSAHIERVFRFFPKAQTHIVIYEEFFSDPARHYAELLQFLDLPHDGRTQFPRINGARALRSKFVVRLLVDNSPAPLRPMLQVAGNLARTFRIHPMRTMWRLNEKPISTKPLRPEFEA